MKQAAILVGGQGTRLGQLTADIPKPMLDIDNRPFLDYLVWNLKRHGFGEIIFLCGYKGEQVRDYFGEGQDGCVFLYSFEKDLAGTAGALLQAKELLRDQFLLINGDTIFDINYLDLVCSETKGPWMVKMALRCVTDVSRYGSVQREDGIVTGFTEKEFSGQGQINGGVYWMKKDIAQYAEGLPCSLEKDILPILVERRLLHAWAYNGFFIDIGLPEELDRARNELPDWKRRPAVFLDRDGVINKDKNYVSRVEDFEWIEGAREAIKLLNDRGYLVIVITNQAGVARGYYTEEDVHALHCWINDELGRMGAHIDAFYYCPHHPEAGIEKYRMHCDCRKPLPGMLLKALEDWPIEREHSCMIGDKEKDVDAANAASINGILFNSGSLFEYIQTSILINWLP
jgi:D-glycero-D-manno-heptose 1,7-bisphosphate phosphatase